jgi:coproporphyrinogen III oxidase-like Fe-S oxidoreductase
MLKTWANGIQNKSPNLEDIVLLDDEEMFSSALIFGLRMNQGINFNQLCQRFPNADAQQYIQPLKNLEQENLLTITNNQIALTKLGRLYADSIAVELLP